MRPFNSQWQVRFNTDPEPVVRPSDGKRGGMSLRGNFLPGQSGPYGIMEKLRIDPRPEYTPVPHNPTSNALTDFRAMHEGKTGDVLGRAASAWLASLMSMGAAGAYDLDEVEHAARVLMRLSRRSLIPA